MAKADNTVWYEFIESKVFSKQVSELPVQVITNIQFDLVQNPERGDIVKGTHGVRKARVADPGSSRGKSGSYRYLYLYLEHAGRIHLLYLIYSAKVTRPTYHRIRRASLANLASRFEGNVSHENRKDSEGADKQDELYEQ